MRFKGITGVEFDIRFKYDRLDDGTVKTACSISFVDPNIDHGPAKYRVCAIGIAMQSVKDTFVKDTGRKVAMTRALKQFKDKYTRKAAWFAYQTRKN